MRLQDTYKLNTSEVANGEISSNFKSRRSGQVGKSKIKFCVRNVDRDVLFHSFKKTKIQYNCSIKKREQYNFCSVRYFLILPITKLFSHACMPSFYFFSDSYCWR